MRIRAEMIEHWADRYEARSDLPILIRRLIGRPEGVTTLIAPGGAAVDRPGFDIVIDGAIGDAWVPAGSSRWELGSGALPADKANADYTKRTELTDPSLREHAAFVFLTARRWPNKTAWVERQSGRGQWREVRAYDATDLEHWLEQEGAVSVWFSELLGMAGPGIHSPEAWLQRWSEQTRIAITPAAMFAGRTTTRAELVDRLAGHATLIGVRADSAEEAAAFACAAAITIGKHQACVVSEAGAWRYVDANPAITIAIAASPEIAAERAPRAGQILVVPLGVLDTAAQTRGAAAGSQEGAVTLARPHHHEMVDALENMGVERSDAERSSSGCGRSWPVYRRLNAHNPSVAHPRWLDRSGAAVLTLVCLVGSWSSERAGDMLIVEQIANRRYEDVERDLLAFSNIDDAPVIAIGSVWKARSPLELLYLAGPRISSAELDRYFDVVEAVLAKPDPALALDPDKRWAANIYGAGREELKLILASICSGLARLAVIGQHVDRFKAADLPGRAARLVRRLFADADPSRWYALRLFLPDLAEAAPDAFLEQIPISKHRIRRRRSSFGILAG